MTPKQMKYMALIGLMVVVLFLATFMSMGVTEGFLTSKERRNNCKPPKFWDTKNNDCVDDCPVGTKKKENDGGFGCFKIKVTHPKCKETVDTPYIELSIFGILSYFSYFIIAKNFFANIEE